MKIGKYSLKELGQKLATGVAMGFLGALSAGIVPTTKDEMKKAAPIFGVALATAFGIDLQTFAKFLKQEKNQQPAGE